MMNVPLTLPLVLERGGRLFPESEIVSRLPDKSLHRYSYSDWYRRSKSLCGALRKLGLQDGDRVATLMWNHFAHLEAYFAIPCSGGVLHTLNLRLHPDQIAYIANHAGDRFLIVDDVLWPLFERFRDQVDFEKIITVPLTGVPVPKDSTHDYESLLEEQDPEFSYPEISEEQALGMCYSSGTTGMPKGVVYSHRSTLLHTLGLGLVDTLNIGHRDVVLPVVPMFHANAWGIPFLATLVGANQVFPGPHLDPVSLLDLFSTEQVSFTAGVPTIWTGIQQELEKDPTRWPLQPKMRSIVGGAAVPESMIRAYDRLGIEIVHAWGMTETSPLGTVSRLKKSLAEGTEQERYSVRAKQGLPVPLVEVRAMDENGPCPADSKSMGELQVRGPWVAGSYHDREDAQDCWTADGWFRTGDVVTIDDKGYVKITDRTKDLIKSGGEWISSVDLENALMGHPAVREAAVIAVPHPKWQERPLAIVSLKEGEELEEDELEAYLKDRFARWWLPDGYRFVDEIPKTSAGKFLKTELRERFAN